MKIKLRNEEGKEEKKNPHDQKELISKHSRPFIFSLREIASLEFHRVFAFLSDPGYVKFLWDQVPTSLSRD